MIKLPKPIIRPILSAGTCSKMMLNMSGKAIPVPRPWMVRPRSRIAKFGAKASSKRPAKKSKLAVTKSCLVLKELFKAAESGTITEMTRR